MAIMTNLAQETTIDKVTMIDARAPALGDAGDLALRAITSSEQVKQVLGVDLLAKLGMGEAKKPTPPPKG
jgi:hypothetical protein